MRGRPLRFTMTDTLFPHTTLCRAVAVLDASALQFVAFFHEPPAQRYRRPSHDMVDARVDDLDEAETGRDGYRHKLSNPVPFLWTMVIFLILVGFIAAILYRQAHTAFMSNPGLNGFILPVLIAGIVLVFNPDIG